MQFLPKLWMLVFNYNENDYIYTGEICSVRSAVYVNYASVQMLLTRWWRRRRQRRPRRRALAGRSAGRWAAERSHAAPPPTTCCSWRTGRTLATSGSWNTPQSHHTYTTAHVLAMIRTLTLRCWPWQARTPEPDRSAAPPGRRSGSWTLGTDAWRDDS